MQPQAKQIPSPNFTTGRKNYRPEAIIIHIMEGSLAGTDSWFQNRASSVSAHYGIGKTGEIHQYVQEKDTAWHAGRVNAPSWNLIKSTGNGGVINPNYYTIGIEHEGNETSEWTDAMYDSCSSLITEICKRWNIPIDRNHIIGHHEIYFLKTCPGSKVDLNKIVEQSRQKAGYNLTFNVTNQTGTVKTTAALRLRSASPSTTAPVMRVAPVGEEISYVAFTEDGQDVEGVKKWYKTVDECWFWGGAIEEINNAFTPESAKEMTLDEIVNLFNIKKTPKLNYNELLNINNQIKQSKGKDCRVGIIDHPIYNGIPLYNSLNRPIASYNPACNHGNEMTGLIAGNGDIFGVAPLTSIIELPIYDDKGYRNLDLFEKIYEYISSNSHKGLIVNISQSLPSTFQGILKKLLKIKNVIIVAAAGTDEDLLEKELISPALYNEVISVGSITETFYTQNKDLNFNKKLDYLIGEFKYISYSSQNGNYSETNGSSSACAIVSGIISLLISSGTLNVYDPILSKDALNNLSVNYSDIKIFNQIQLIKPRL